MVPTGEQQGRREHGLWRQAAGLGVAATLLMPLLLTGCGGGGGGGLDCSNAIADCTKVNVPSGASDCSAAKCEVCKAGLEPFADDKGSFCGLNCVIAHCNLASTPMRGASSCAEANVICQACDDSYELQVDRKTLMPTGQCSFACTDHQVANGCAPRSCSDGSSCDLCLPGFKLQSFAAAPLEAEPLQVPSTEQAQKGTDANVSENAQERIPSHMRFLAADDKSTSQATTACIPEDKPVPMTFYMYRAQPDTDYPPENTDLASAAGVIWYLHNEVVARKQTCPPAGRKFGISRVLRYKVTVHNTQQVFDHPPGKRQIGHFVQFDSGQCTQPSATACTASNWNPFGYMVGCQKQAFQKYYASPHEYGCYWYSLPGPCPSHTYNDRSKDCAVSEPGGHCANPDGSATCTWTYESAGEVSMNELSGIQDMTSFCHAGNYEYNDPSDKGQGTTYWDDKENPARGRDRVQRLLQLFAAKYPSNESALELPDPVCDGW